MGSSAILALTSPIVGIENRTAQEVFDIMCDRFRLAARPAPDHAGLDGAEEKRIDELRMTAFRTNADADRQAYFDAASKWFQDRHYRRMEAATALSATSPAPLEGVTVTPIGYARSVDVDPKHRPMEGRISFWCTQDQNAYYSVPVYLSAIVGSAK